MIEASIIASIFKINLNHIFGQKLILKLKNTLFFLPKIYESQHCNFILLNKYSSIKNINSIKYLNSVFFHKKCMTNAFAVPFTFTHLKKY